MKKEMTDIEAIAYAHNAFDHQNFSEAISICEQFLACHQPKVEVLDLLGAAYHSSARYDDAIGCLEKLILIDPDQETTYHKNLGMILKESKRYAEAIPHYNRMLEFDNRDVKSLNSKGICLKQLEKYEEALECYDLALSIMPDFSDAIINKGISLKHLGRYEEALECYSRALELSPCNHYALQNICVLHSEIKNYSEAIKYADLLLEVFPNNPDALIVKGNIYLDFRKIADAFECYEKAYYHNPKNDLAKFHLFSYLLLEDFARGWKYYEHRWQIEAVGKHKRPFTQAQWKGENLNGKNIIVWSEQGFGDCILFASYIPILASQANHVLVEVQSKLVKLFQYSFPQVEVVVSKKVPELLNSARYDYQIPMGSVLQYFIQSVSDIHPEPGYLKVDKNDVELSSKYFLDKNKLKVGLVWAGNPKYTHDKSRSIPFSIFASMIEQHPNIQFYSLQVGDSKNELLESSVSSRVVDLSVYVEDFYDTATMIANCDLIISADTSVLHLSGSLNKKTWALIPYACDWRWFLDREDTPWYKSVRLFRQSESGDWETVLRRVSSELLTLSDDVNHIT